MPQLQDKFCQVAVLMQGQPNGLTVETVHLVHQDVHHQVPHDTGMVRTKARISRRSDQVG